MKRNVLAGVYLAGLLLSQANFASDGDHGPGNSGLKKIQADCVIKTIKLEKNAEGEYHPSETGEDKILKEMTLDLEGNPDPEYKGSYSAWPRYYFTINPILDVLNTGKMINEVSKDHSEPHYEILFNVFLLRDYKNFQDKVELGATFIKHIPGETGDDGILMFSSDAKAKNFIDELEVRVSPGFETIGFMGLLGSIDFACKEAKN